jgi:hypothetical protein
MPRASTAKASALAGLLVVLAGAAVLWAPYLLRARPVITSTPSPGPTYSRLDVPLRPGSEACVDHVSFVKTTGQLEVYVSSRQPGNARLDMEARAPGYIARGSVTVPTAIKAAPARAAIAPPPRTVRGTVCVRNTGAASVALLGTNEATSIGLSQTSVDGRPLGPSHGARLALLEGRQRSIVSRLGTITQRASDFTGGLMPAWLLWPLVVVLVLATPFALFGAFWLAFREEPG